MNSQEYRDLSEAYLDVYENEQLDEMPYRVVTKNDRGEEVYVGGKYATTKTARTKVDKEDEKVGGYRHSIRKVDEAKDIFNYVMEYLISEGYVDTLQGAEKITKNIGQEWINDIINEAGKVLPYGKVADKMRQLDGEMKSSKSPKEKEKLRKRLDKIGDQYWQPN